MPPGDTPNLKYWEGAVTVGDPVSVHETKVFRLENPEISDRYKELARKFLYSMPSRLEIFNCYLDNGMYLFPRPLWEDTFYYRLPKSHLSFVVHGCIYKDIVGHPRFGRLSRISNLGVTTFEIPCATHSRVEHSIGAAIMAEVILRRNGFSEHDINVGIAAALLHDIAMPPLSDYGKSACPRELDEEDNIELVLKDKTFRKIFRKYGITPDEVVGVVRGEGLVGQIINSLGVDVDKIAYTAIDHSRTYGELNWGKMRIIRRDPYLFDIFEDVELRNREFVYKDPQRLFRFLMVRATMFDKVHFAPESRAREAHIKGILEGLWRSGKLKKDEMLLMDDDAFLRKLEGLDVDIQILQSLSFPFVELGRYQTVAEARKKHRGRNAIIDKWRTFNPATLTKTLIGEEVVSFRDGFPEKAALIEAIATRNRYVGVYGRLEDSEDVQRDPEILDYLTRKAKAEKTGIPRLILRYADLEPGRRVRWALRQRRKRKHFSPV